jgi:hypothetical protein
MNNGRLVLVLLASIGVAACGETPPRPTYEVVRTCDPPMFRRAKEFILKDGDGQLWFQDRHNRLVKVAKGASLNDICRKGVLP